MKRGGVVSERISRFEQLCHSTSNSSVNAKNNGNTSMASSQKMDNGYVDYRSMDQVPTQMPHNSHSRDHISHDSNKNWRTVKTLPAPCEITKEWRDIISIDIPVGGKYLLEVTADGECTSSDEKEVKVDICIKSKTPVRNMTEDVLTQICHCQPQQQKSQFTMRKLVDLTGVNGSNIIITCEIRSSINSMRLSNVMMTCISMQ